MTDEHHADRRSFLRTGAIAGRARRRTVILCWLWRTFARPWAACIISHMSAPPPNAPSKRTAIFGVTALEAQGCRIAFSRVQAIISSR
jgi:hypothetical protein